MSESASPAPSATPSSTPPAAPSERSAKTSANSAPNVAPAPLKTGAATSAKTATKPEPQTTKTGAGVAARAAAAAEPAETPVEEAKPKAEKRQYKYKANKEEVVEELSEEDIVQRLSKAKGADKAFQEKAELEKSVKAFFDALKSDPWSVLNDPTLGVDLKKIARQKLAEEYERQIEEERLSPEAKEAKAAREEAERYKKEIEERKASDRKKAEDAYREKVRVETEQKLVEALTQHGLDKTPETLADAAQVMRANLRLPKDLRLTPAQVAEEVRNRQEARNERFRKAAMSGLKGEKLLAALGGADSAVLREALEALPPDSPIIKAIVQKRLASIKKPTAFENPKPKVEEAPPAKKEPFDRAKWRRENILGIIGRD
jgi:hypothetical protein